MADYGELLMIELSFDSYVAPAGQSSVVTSAGLELDERINLSQVFAGAWASKPHRKLHALRPRLRRLGEEDLQPLDNPLDLPVHAREHLRQFLDGVEARVDCAKELCSKARALVFVSPICTG